MALIYATCHAHAECMELLIDAGADVHQPLNDPLLITARFGHAKCLELLIRKGANVNRPIFIGGGNSGVDMPTIWCNTPLRAASKYNHTKCVEILLKAGARVNSNTVVPLIIDSVSTCSDHTLRVLLAAGADVNAVDSHNNTPLIVAAEQKINRVKILLEAKAKINMFNKNKKNALYNHVEKRISQKKSPDKTMVLLLYAAGEMPCGITTSCVLDYLGESEICLKDMCREEIRHYLLNTNPHENLFCRVPRLGLPPLLTQYILYNMSLK